MLTPETLRMHPAVASARAILANALALAEAEATLGSTREDVRAHVEQSVAIANLVGADVDEDDLVAKVRGVVNERNLLREEVSRLAEEVGPAKGKQLHILLRRAQTARVDASAPKIDALGAGGGP